MQKWRENTFIILGRVALAFGLVFVLSGCSSGLLMPKPIPLDGGGSVGLRVDGRGSPPAIEFSSRGPVHLGLTINHGEGLRYQVTSGRGAGAGCRGRLEHGRVERCGPLPGGLYRVVVDTVPLQNSDAEIWLWASAWNDRGGQGILHLRARFTAPALVGALYRSH